MLKLKMKYTRRGTQDGFHLETFEAGKEYWMADTCARDFIAREEAELAAPLGALPTPEELAAIPPLGRARQRTIDPNFTPKQSVLIKERSAVWSRF